MSNLANSLRERQKPEWSEYFSGWIMHALQEQHIRATGIAPTDAFSLVGITGAALFQLAAGVPILTLDARLAASMQRQNREALNFNHLRQSWLFS